MQICILSGVIPGVYSVMAWRTEELAESYQVNQGNYQSYALHIKKLRKQNYTLKRTELHKIAGTKISINVIIYYVYYIYIQVFGQYEPY